MGNSLQRGKETKFWVDLKNMLQKEASTQGYILSFHLYKMSRVGKLLQSRLEVPSGRQLGVNGSRVSFRDDKHALKLDRGDGCTSL